MNVFDKAPVVDKDAFVAPSASIIGDVKLGRGSSIWYGCVLRGKINISLFEVLRCSCCFILYLVLLVTIILLVLLLFYSFLGS